MLFNSPIFLFAFLPLTLVGYAVLLRTTGGRGVMAYLSGASLLFYSWWNPAYTPLIVLTVLTNYGLGHAIATASGQPRRLLTTLGVSGNLGLLGYFKYAGFFAQIANDLAGTQWAFLAPALPLAISFYTFQQISFLLDIHQRKTAAPAFWDYAAYVLFFPQLIAGPIVHHKTFFRQREDLLSPQRISEDIVIGMSIFAIGLFKKVVIADNFATHATPVFSAAQAGDPLHAFEAFRGVAAYTLQIYFDFSGYSDMAIGLGRCFGIRLPTNFNSPYRAASIIEFWRCWHMTLSQFLRDYLYIPMGGNRNGRIRRHINLFLTMLIGGLWHGASWTFVFWGALHGAYLMVNHGWTRLTDHAHWLRLPGWMGRIITLLAVMLAWIFFRAESFAAAGHLLKAFLVIPVESLTSTTGLLSWLGFEVVETKIRSDDTLYFWLFPVFIMLCWWLPNTQQIFARTQPTAESLDTPITLLPRQQRTGWLLWKPSLRWAIVVGAAAAASLLSLQQVSEFLYFQF